LGFRNCRKFYFCDGCGCGGSGCGLEERALVKTFELDDLGWVLMAVKEDF